MTTKTEITLRDYRMLAKAYPREDPLIGTVSCTIGYSLEYHQLVRWATMPQGASPDIGRWVGLTGKFGRGLDGRPETLAPIMGSLDYATPKKISPARGMAEVRSLAVPGVNGLFALRKSIAVVEPTITDVYWTTTGQDQDRSPSWRLARPHRGLKKLPERLRVRFSTPNGATHDCTVLDWQFYEAARRFTEKGYPDPLVETTRSLTSPDWQHLFVMGDIASHQGTFTVVGILSTKQ